MRRLRASRQVQSIEVARQFDDQLAGA